MPGNECQGVGHLSVKRRRVCVKHRPLSVKHRPLSVKASECPRRGKAAVRLSVRYSDGLTLPKACQGLDSAESGAGSGAGVEASKASKVKCRPMSSSPLIAILRRLK